MFTFTYGAPSQCKTGTFTIQLSLEAMIPLLSLHTFSPAFLGLFVFRLLYFWHHLIFWGLLARRHHHDCIVLEKKRGIIDMGSEHLNEELLRHLQGLGLENLMMHCEELWWEAAAFTPSANHGGERYFGSPWGAGTRPLV
ncbi:hypothetical protein LZ31DRAFT_292005 [Colletotrichum somersetense]|nr:hypothetical protein LZ31DRAFT_292005 [Colletotrichum somersetense]